MALGGRIDLVRPIDCARLSFHGGSCWRALRPGLVTGRIARPVRSRRSQISTITGTSPLLDQGPGDSAHGGNARSTSANLGETRWGLVPSARESRAPFFV